VIYIELLDRLNELGFQVVFGNNGGIIEIISIDGGTGMGGPRDWKLFAELCERLPEIEVELRKGLLGEGLGLAFQSREKELLWTRQ
jgi:hypothetical protein